ncbi:hypothetical protein [Bradyrhizobium sp. Ce-3]|uniref:hypothetical protein n=1 Tax=Bradyrhizobium sp. Ce-3 TaxID=2913970 RepID=UPI001FBA28AF|nr:hypothetical protein [Bradyrhizobium sp. Ce-3]
MALIALTGIPGITYREIAIRLGRTEAAVSCRLTLIRKDLAEQASTDCPNSQQRVS